MKLFRKKDNLEFEFLPAALEIEQTPPSPLGSLMIWIIFFIILFTVLWSYLATIDEVVMSRGKVVSEASVKVNSPLEGTIKKVHVTEWQRVKRGDLLLELSPIQAKSSNELHQIYSPVNGTITTMTQSTTGEIVAATQPLFQLLPDESPILVEATVLNKDIGFVSEGQDTQVKIDTFPFQKYGTVKGKVIAISPDSFDDPVFGPSFKMKVQLESQSLLVNGGNTPIKPGLTVTVESKTGKKRIIEFFLSPVIKSLKESITLR